MRLIDADALMQNIPNEEMIAKMAVAHAPSIEPKAKMIVQVTFDEDKLHEIVNEAVERIKEEYDIVDNPNVSSVVQCKECRYCKRKKGTLKGEPIFFYRCEENNRDVESDDYCSLGERCK